MNNEQEVDQFIKTTVYTMVGLCFLGVGTVAAGLWFLIRSLP